MVNGYYCYLSDTNLIKIIISVALQIEQFQLIIFFLISSFFDKSVSSLYSGVLSKTDMPKICVISYNESSLFNSFFAYATNIIGTYCNPYLGFYCIWSSTPKPFYSQTHLLQLQNVSIRIKAQYGHKKFLWHYILIFRIVGGIAMPTALKIL